MSSDVSWAVLGTQSVGRLKKGKGILVEIAFVRSINSSLHHSTSLKLVEIMSEECLRTTPARGAGEGALSPSDAYLECNGFLKVALQAEIR